MNVARLILGPRMADPGVCAECGTPVAAGVGVREMRRVFCCDAHAGLWQEGEVAL